MMAREMVEPTGALDNLCRKSSSANVTGLSAIVAELLAPEHESTGPCGCAP